MYKCEQKIYNLFVYCNLQLLEAQVTGGYFLELFRIPNPWMSFRINDFLFERGGSSKFSLTLLLTPTLIATLKSINYDHFRVAVFIHFYSFMRTRFLSCQPLAANYISYWRQSNFLLHFLSTVKLFFRYDDIMHSLHVSSNGRGFQLMFYFYYHLSVNIRAQKIECTWAVNTYVFKSKLPTQKLDKNRK